MANGNRTLGIVLALVVGLVGGWVIARLTSPGLSSRSAGLPIGAGNHLVGVGPTAKDVGAVLHTIHKMAWKARDQNMRLEIRFKAANFPQNGEPPFQNGAVNQDQVFTCGPGPGNPCNSGPVNGQLNIPDGGLYFKYWQTLIDQNGNRDTADAGIIIEK